MSGDAFSLFRLTGEKKVSPRSHRAEEISPPGRKSGLPAITFSRREVAEAAGIARGGIRKEGPGFGTGNRPLSRQFHARHQMIFHEFDFLDTRYHDLGIDLESSRGDLIVILHFGQDVSDAVEPCLLLVVGTDDGPGRYGPVGFIEHLEFSDGIVIPLFLSFQIDSGDLILLQWILHSRLESTHLLFLGNGEKELEHDDPVLYKDFLDQWHIF